MTLPRAMKSLNSLIIGRSTFPY
jgi:hypothetical protein